MKYNKVNGSIYMSMRTIERSEDHMTCEFKIKDNGIGILENELNRVFDKGFTGTTGRTKQKSTGIGLYLCKKLCYRLNHEIKIDSNSHGTVVTLVFPYSSHITLQ